MGYVFQKSGNMSDDEVKQSSQNGRNFISSLIELTGADVSGTVKEKVFPGDVPAKEEEKFTKDGNYFIRFYLSLDKTSTKILVCKQHVFTYIFCFSHVLQLLNSRLLSE